MRAARKEPFSAMPHLGHLAVNGNFAADDARPECFGQGLVTETDAEERNGGVGADEIENAAGARRSAGPRRDDDGAGAGGDQLRRLEGVVADDGELASGKPLDLLDKVVGEGVVVIDDDDWGGAKDAPVGRRSWGERISHPRRVRYSSGGIGN